MLVDAVQSYLDMTNAVAKAARARAAAVARGALAQAGLEETAAEAGERATRLAEEASAARRANRELVETLLTTEVAKVASRFGFVRSEDLDEVREEIAELRVQLKKAQQPATARAPRKTAGPAAATGSAGTVPPARKAAARRSAAKKAEPADGVANVDPFTDAGA